MIFQTKCIPVRSSKLYCKPLIPGISNAVVNVTDVDFKSSQWAAVDVDIFFHNCQLKSLNITSLGTTLGSQPCLHISHCTIGSHMWIRNSRATLEHCVSNLTRMVAALIEATNSTIILKNLHIENFNVGIFLETNKCICHLFDVRFMNCTSKYLFPLVQIFNESLLHIQNCTFYGNDVCLINIESNSSTIIKNSSFVHNMLQHKKTKYVPLLKLMRGCLLVISDSDFSYNTIKRGISVVAVENGSVGVIQNSSFKKNQGGVFFMSNSAGIISHCQFKQNTGLTGSALLFVCDRELEKETTKLVQNSLKILSQHQSLDPVTKMLEILEQSRLKHMLPGWQVQNSSFVSVFGKLLVQSCVFSKSQAKGRGGAISFDVRTSEISLKTALVISNSSFENNQALGNGVSAQGGAIGVIGGDTEHGHLNSLVISDSSFSNNQALFTGGAIWTASYLSVRDSIFQQNSARIAGALEFPSGQITKCYFDSNTALGAGGALELMPGSNINVSHSKFSNNMALGGGAIIGGDNASFSCDSCVFHNNTAIGSLR